MAAYSKCHQKSFYKWILTWDGTQNILMSYEIYSLLNIRMTDQVISTIGQPWSPFTLSFSSATIILLWIKVVWLRAESAVEESRHQLTSFPCCTTCISAVLQTLLSGFLSWCKIGSPPLWGRRAWQGRCDFRNSVGAGLALKSCALAGNTNIFEADWNSGRHPSCFVF